MSWKKEKSKLKTVPQQFRTIQRKEQKRCFSKSKFPYLVVTEKTKVCIS